MRTPFLIAATFTLLFAGVSGSSFAERRAVLPFADELDSCVAAVTEHLDLSGAERVRHTVVEDRRTGIGYALSIETSVFSADSERRYSAYCVATGSGAPIKFRIDERVD